MLVHTIVLFVSHYYIHRTSYYIVGMTLFTLIYSGRMFWTLLLFLPAHYRTSKAQDVQQTQCTHYSTTVGFSRQKEDRDHKMTCVTTMNKTLQQPTELSGSVVRVRVRVCVCV